VDTEETTAVPSAMLPHTIGCVLYVTTGNIRLNLAQYSGVSA